MSAADSSILVAAGVLCINDRILLGQRRESGAHPLKWEFPGGKLEPGETAAAALVRELREELAVDATPGPTLWVTRHRYPAGPSVALTFIGTLAIDRMPRNLVFADLRWVPIAALGAVDLLEADREFGGALQAGTVVPIATRRRNEIPVEDP